MNKKEYRIESSGNYVTIEEVEPTYADPGTINPNPTFRERVGFRLRRSSRVTKFILTLFGDIYGVLHRWSSNRGILYLLSFVQLGLQIYAAKCLIDGVNFFIIGNSSMGVHMLWRALPFSILWIIDLLSVLVCGEIRILGHKRYRDYRG